MFNNTLGTSVTPTSIIRSNSNGQGIQTWDGYDFFGIPRTSNGNIRFGNRGMRNTDLTTRETSNVETEKQASSISLSKGING